MDLYICYRQVFTQTFRPCIPFKILNQSDQGAFSTKYNWVFFLWKKFSICFLDLFICYLQVIMQKHRHYIPIRIVDRSNLGALSYEIYPSFFFFFFFKWFSIRFLDHYICYHQVLMQTCCPCILFQILNQSDQGAFSFEI